MVSLNRKKITLGLIGLMAVILPVILIVVSRQQDTRSGAFSPVSITFNPQTGTYAPGTIIPVKLILNAGTNNIAYLKVNVAFDADNAEFLSFEKSTKFDEFLSGPTVTTTNQTGGRSLSFELINITQAPNNNTIEIGTLTFRSRIVGTLGLDYSLAEIYEAGITTQLGISNNTSASFNIADVPTQTPTLTPTLTPSITPSPTPTRTPTPSPTQTPTPTRTPTPSPTQTPTPTRTPTPSPTGTPTPSPTSGPTPTNATGLLCDPDRSAQSLNIINQLDLQLMANELRSTSTGVKLSACYNTDFEVLDQLDIQALSNILRNVQQPR